MIQDCETCMFYFGECELSSLLKTIFENELEGCKHFFSLADWLDDRGLRGLPITL